MHVNIEKRSMIFCVLLHFDNDITQRVWHENMPSGTTVTSGVAKLESTAKLLLVQQEICSLESYHSRAVMFVEIYSTTFNDVIMSSKRMENH